MKRYYLFIMIWTIISLAGLPIGWSQANAPDDPLSLGVAFGYVYNKQDYSVHLQQLGVKRTHINIWWHKTEPQPGNYNYTIIDSFVNQLHDSTVALIRIDVRRNGWATKDENQTVPKDLTIGGSYYNYVYNVVLRTNGRVKYFENNWEADTPSHWSGTPAEYAELTRTFYRAVKDADSNAVVIMGGAVGTLGEESKSFFSVVFADLVDDQMEKSFDQFDVHLYHNLYDIPERIRWFRNALDSYPEFQDKPIIVTEYGGPTPMEFQWGNPAAYDSLLSAITTDPCIFATGLQGYPDPLRMFAYGDIGTELKAKRDRIQARQMVQRSLLSFSEGVTSMFWWNLKADPMAPQGPDCDFYHPIFGKMRLMDELQDGTLIPNQNFINYKKMTKDLGTSFTAVERVATSNDTLFYLFEITREDDSKVFVVWERRDQFYGEEQFPTSFTLVVPWPAVKISGLFLDEPLEIHSIPDGLFTFEITDTPVFVEELIATSLGDNADITQKSFTLSQNHPNPFSESTTINYELRVAGRVTVRVNDMLGNEVAELVDEYLEAGRRSTVFNADGLPSGVYYYTIESNGKVESGKVVLVR